MASRAPLSAALLALFAGCGSTSRAVLPAQPMVEAAEFGSIVNVSESDGIWFGGLPAEEDLELARRRGVERLIAVCDREIYADLELRAACTASELELIELGAPENGAFNLRRLLDLLADAERPKTLVFCVDGSRSTMLFAIHRIVHEGLDVEEALAEARRSGMPGGACEDFVRSRVARVDS